MLSSVVPVVASVARAAAVDDRIELVDLVVRAAGRAVGIGKHAAGVVPVVGYCSVVGR